MSVIPKNETAEKVAIASLLTGAPPYAVPLRPEHFAMPDNRLVFGAIRTLADDDRPVSVHSVTSHLIANGTLEAAGGPVARFLCPDIPTGGEAVLRHFYPDLEDARRNREVVLHIHKHLADLTTLRMDATSFAEALAEIAAPQSAVTAADTVADIIARMEARITTGETREVFPTGLDPLDKHLGGGFHRGELAVIAGNTGGGKSALLIQAAVACAALERRVIYYTLELGEEELTERAAAAYRRVPLGDMKRLRSALCDLQHLPLVIRQGCGDQLADIAADLRAETRAGRCDLAVIDYLQRVGNASDSRELEVSGISRTLKSLAMREQIPVLTASQLNENGALRESRAIGHDADFVLVIGEEDLLVDKFRRGPRGVRLACHLRGAESRFVPSATRVS